MYYRVENTPYYITGNDEIGYFLTFGKYKITEHKKTEEEALECLTTNMWTIIVDTISCIMTMNDEEKLK